jgi:hypothetical protein
MTHTECICTKNERRQHPPSFLLRPGISELAARRPSKNCDSTRHLSTIRPSWQRTPTYRHEIATAVFTMTPVRSTDYESLMLPCSLLLPSSSNFKFCWVTSRTLFVLAMTSGCHQRRERYTKRRETSLRVDVTPPYQNCSPFSNNKEFVNSPKRRGNASI